MFLLAEFFNTSRASYILFYNLISLVDYITQPVQVHIQIPLSSNCHISIPNNFQVDTIAASINIYLPQTLILAEKVFGFTLATFA